MLCDDRRVVARDHRPPGDPGRVALSAVRNFGSRHTADIGTYAGDRRSPSPTGGINVEAPMSRGWSEVACHAASLSARALSSFVVMSAIMRRYMRLDRCRLRM